MKNPKTLNIVCALVVSSLVSVSMNAQNPVLALADGTKIDKDKNVVVEANKNAAPTDVNVAAEVKADEEEAPTFTLSGSIDTYFHSSFGTTNPFMGGSSGPSTSFCDLKGFSLGMANIIASYSGEKAGFVGDLVFGPRGRAAVFGTASGQAVVNQLLAYYKVTPGFTLNLGQFNTFLGYEVISPATNFHYSTSYMFSWGPFNHTGLRADFDLGGGLIAKAAIMNPTDIVEFNPVDTYTLGGQIGYTNDNGGAWLNFLYGDQDGKLEEGEPGDGSAGSLFQVDLTTGWSLTDNFYLGVNTTLQSTAPGQVIAQNGSVQDADGESSSFMGFAVYPKLSLSESFALGLRAEYFSTKNFHFASPIIGVNDAGDGSVTAFTLSGNYKVGGLTLIPEFRLDTANEDSFLKDNTAEKSMTSFTFAAVYKF